MKRGKHYRYVGGDGRVVFVHGRRSLECYVGPRIASSSGGGTGVGPPSPPPAPAPMVSVPRPTGHVNRARLVVSNVDQDEANALLALLELLRCDIAGEPFYTTLSRAYEFMQDKGAAHEALGDRVHHASVDLQAAMDLCDSIGL